MLSFTSIQDLSNDWYLYYIPAFANSHPCQNEEEECAAELVDGGGGVVDLAHDGPKRPLCHGHCYNEEGDTH